MTVRHWLCPRGSARVRIGQAWQCALRGREQGQGMLEYAIISGAIIVGTVAVLSGLSGSLNHIFSTISTTLSQY